MSWFMGELQLEYNYIALGLIKENSAANSPLWTRLAGTIEPNKQNKKKICL